MSDDYFDCSRCPQRQRDEKGCESDGKRTYFEGEELETKRCPKSFYRDDRALGYLFEFHSHTEGKLGKLNDVSNLLVEAIDVISAGRHWYQMQQIEQRIKQ